jgi:DNA replicative helicase MCM subunit Mcm2 (Cdc46/Mcm family)
MSILGSGANTMSSVDLPFVQRYIALSKRVEPEFTEQAREYIAKQHAEKRAADKGDYMRSHRLVPALQRLALATARFDFSETVTLEHVKYAEKICAASINEEDPGLLTGAVDKESRKKTEDTKRIVKELMDRKGKMAALAGIETNEIKTTLKANDIQYSNSADLNIALRSLPFLTPQGSKWVYEKED